MADVGCLSVSSTALTVGNGCITFILSAIPFLRTYYFDYDKNKNEFVERKNEAKSKKGAFNMQLALATGQKKKPQEDVENWIHDYKVKIQECDLLEKDLEPNSGRRCCPCKICKLNQKLLEMTQKITLLIDRYDKFRSCMFIEDLNRQILDNFEATKSKFEALTAFRSLEQVSDQSDGIEKWRREYEEMKRQCDDIENKLKNYNTEGESFVVCIEDVNKKTTEMTVLIDRYNLIYTKHKFEVWKHKFEVWKHKFEALTAFRSLEELSDQSDGIEKWSQEYEEMKRQCDDIENKLKNYNTEKGESFGVCIEDVNKKTTELTELIDRYKKLFVQCPPIVVKRSTDFMFLDSRKNKMTQVYKALEEKRVIKLFGIGGIGKTTLMEQINNEMSAGTNFKFVIWVDVSTKVSTIVSTISTVSTTDVKDIQSQIYRRLNLEFTEKHIDERAERLSEYFKSVDGCCLFIFDGVWGALDLEKIGIPNGNYGNDGMNCCKIVLTTRDKSIKVFNGMLHEDIEMDLLNDEAESWELFKKNASIADNIDNGIKGLAKEICRKCARLPLMISRIAKNLNGVKEKAFWCETLTCLNKNDLFRPIPVLLNEVYISLKKSYDHLEREDLKICFLICSLFPKDHKIKLSEIEASCESLEDCYTKFIHLREKGLLHDWKEDSARMRKVIRDVARKIAEDEYSNNILFTRYNGLFSFTDSNRISQMVLHE